MATPNGAAAAKQSVDYSKDGLSQHDIKAIQAEDKFEPQLDAKKKRGPPHARSMTTRVKDFRAQMETLIAKGILTPEQVVVKEERYYRNLLSDTKYNQKADREMLQLLIEDAVARRRPNRKEQDYCELEF